jgi:hypothetical protein
VTCGHSSTNDGVSSRGPWAAFVFGSKIVGFRPPPWIVRGKFREKYSHALAKDRHENILNFQYLVLLWVVLGMGVFELKP